MNTSELRVVAALASVLLNVPWMVAVGWVIQLYTRATGVIAGEVLLVPILVWMATAPFAIALGVAALVGIRGSTPTSWVRWIGVLGIALAATVPLFGAVYRAAEALR